MKQFAPLIIIAALIGGALLFFQDPVEEVFDPYWEREQAGFDAQEWEITIFIDEGEERLPEVGVKLVYLGDPEDITDYEFFYSSMNTIGGFYDQQLDLKDFGGEIFYRTSCNFCSETEDYSEGDFSLSWKKNGEIHTVKEHFTYPGYVFREMQEQE
ncbi:hypothetical protein [Alteribacter keqinensis]|uniref:Uncharacterized protein n=1 Tax=Alteribacter keqinensis TaxID=2483800 RepID=A0A3M7TNQ3_9BACI|nr:hypothetical protein [Alteribacter keqinensis]RNA67165.1 hypothetical protein EBO34_18460 [Alteribacter keqinensis]